MNAYATAVLIGGVAIPIFLHMIGGAAMPWWPDTVTMGIAFGAAALAMVWQSRKDRELRRRLWSAIRALGRR
jgi:phosphotransferase system  glucose/maltose/N-acetylglucosamine-specific IIC component